MILLKTNITFLILSAFLYSMIVHLRLAWNFISKALVSVRPFLSWKDRMESSFGRLLACILDLLCCCSPRTLWRYLCSWRGSSSWKCRWRRCLILWILVLSFQSVGFFGKDRTDWTSSKLRAACRSSWVQRLGSHLARLRMVSLVIWSLWC